MSGRILELELLHDVMDQVKFPNREAKNLARKFIEELVRDLTIADYEAGPLVTESALAFKNFLDTEYEAAFVAAARSKLNDVGTEEPPTDSTDEDS